MNRKKKSRGISPSKEGIKLLETTKADGQEGKPLTFQGIAEKAEVSERTVKRFFKGEGVDLWSARRIIEALGLKEEDVILREQSLVAESIEKIDSR